jgi:hypothetical protein
VRPIKPYCIVALLVFLPLLVNAQLVKYGPTRTTPVKAQKLPNAKTHAPNPINLPFWDDFSRVKGHTADSSLWINNDKVFINDGQAINPPTINVATFDGYNENGLPYVPNDFNVSGFGDTLTSQFILMADVPLAQRNDIYLSFFYQAGGNSEPPNQADFLRLEFLDEDSIWTEIETYYPGDDFDPTVFHEVAIQINEPKYFHNEFQFRFLFYGRLSGAYDSWHLDYVYLNRRVIDDEETEFTGDDGYNSSTSSINEYDKNTSISDRAMTKPFTSILTDDYFSIPYSHFITNPANNLNNPFLYFFNLKDASFAQVISYTSHFTITNYKGNTPEVTFNNNLESLVSLAALTSRQHAIRQIQNLPSTSYFDPLADSALVTAQIGFNSGDMENDFYTRYGDINFFSNDTLSRNFTLSNYYAYDDGQAEYAAGLTQQGNQFAYRFIMKTDAVDTLNGVYIYFPHFGGAIPTSTVLSIYKNKNGFPDSQNVLYNQSIPIIQTTNSKFEFFKLNEGILVQDTFYIGYRETITDGTTRIRIGLDASHDTGHHMFYRSSELAAWRVNDAITGTFMIRPRFGPGDVITSIEDVYKPLVVYPNPSTGTFFVKGRAEQLQLIFITGQTVPHTAERMDDGTKITLPNPVPGVYILRYRSGAKMFTEKVIVK